MKQCLRRLPVISPPMLILVCLIPVFCAGLILSTGCRRDGQAEPPAQTLPEVARLVGEAGERRAAGDVTGARASLEEALRLQPDDPKALVALGRLQLLDFSDPDAALATYRRAVRAAPNDPEAR